MIKVGMKSNHSAKMLSPERKLLVVYYLMLTIGILQCKFAFFESFEFAIPVQNSANF